MTLDPRARTALVDGVPSLVLAAAAGHELLYNDAGAGFWLLGQGMVWLLVLRRRAPVVVLGLTLLLASTGWALDTLLIADLAVLVALHAVASQRPRADSLVAAACVEAGALLVAFRFAPTGSVNDAVVLLTGLVLSALFLGTTQRAQRHYLEALEERAVQLKRERHDKARIAAGEERTRIAREIHDIVAHSVSVMIALSEGAAATADVQEARSAARQAAATGRQALTELRRVLSVLHEEAGPQGRSPQPAVESLADLARSVQRAGVQVELQVDPAAAGLPEALQATVYRIVQESLTNTLKHAEGATSTRVSVVVDPEEVRIVAHDDGRPAPVRSREGPPGGGSGLQGMRERAAMYGGSLTAGPEHGGWLTTATLRRDAGGDA